MNCPSCRAHNDTLAPACFACGAALDAALASLAQGAIFASRYEVLGPLGRGGMGMVYRAFDRELGETVAIKVLRPDVARESGRVEQRFRSEIRLARRVRHRNVCSIFGDGEDRGLLFICMELVEGENLAGRARESGGLPHDEAWSAALQVADGLCAIHEAGVVHRDLKTANLMRDRAGVVRVMDFGIAKQHGATSGITVTATGSLMGTPEYMSPEQLRGEDVDYRSDLYSLGVVIVELFTGQLPFRGETPVATIVRQLHDEPFLDLPSLPSALRPVIAKALAKASDDRYSSAVEMRGAIEAACGMAAPSLLATPSDGTGERRPEDETRPLIVGEAPPIGRMAVAQAALALVAVHLVSAGGVASPQLPPLPLAAAFRLPARAPAAPHAPARSRGAEPDEPRVDPTPVPTPLPTTPALLPVSQPDVALLPEPVDVRVYDEEEVDEKPRRIAGSSASYPDWGPKLERGRSVSITASFVVNEAGDVTDIRVEQGGGVLEAVLLELSRWKYEPGVRNGRPVKVRVSWKHTFIGA
jgi:serine/threonine-protein kinase